MGLFLRQDEGRSQLQTRLAEELREKARNAQHQPGAKPEPTSELLANEQQTRPAGMVLMILAMIGIIVCVLWIVSGL